MTDEEAVETANRAFYAALEARDLSRMALLWSHDDEVSCIHPGWHRLDGWDEVERSWRAIFANSRPWKVSCETPRIAVGGSLALVVCIERLATVGGEGEPARMQATNVLRRIDGGWKMIHHHSNPLPEIQGDEDEETIN